MLYRPHPGIRAKYAFSVLGSHKEPAIHKAYAMRTASRKRGLPMLVGYSETVVSCQI